MKEINETLLNKLYVFYDEALKSIKMKLKENASEFEIAYHYTNSEGLKGIIESKKMWATNCFFLNDPREFFYGWRFVGDVLARISTKVQKSKRYKKIIDEYIQKAETALVNHGGIPLDLYIISFSEECDSLSQWRAYTKNEKGYVIGINPHDIPHATFDFDFYMSQEFPVLNFIKVIYDLDTQISLIIETFDNLVNGIISCLKENKITYRQGEHEIIWIMFFLHIFFCALLKDPHFKDEREIRILLFCPKSGNILKKDNDINTKALFRIANEIITPYIEVDFSSKINDNIMPIKEIITGPNHDIKSLMGLDIFLKQKGYNNKNMPDLSLSNILLK